jgi:uncharacterized protein (TIGR03083 family)
MTLPKDEIIAGYNAELEHFEQLVRSLPEDAWRRPSRCEGWTVADVATHVAGTLTEIVEGRFDGLGTPERTQQIVVDRRRQGPAETADELAKSREVGASLLAAFDDATWQGPALGGLPGTIGEGVEGLWYDTYVHAEDIRAAAGLPSEGGPGLRGSVIHLATLLTAKGWGPATLTLDGLDPVPVGGGGPAITGDPLAFVLTATGRADPSTIGLDPSVNVYGDTP